MASPEERLRRLEEENRRLRGRMDRLEQAFGWRPVPEEGPTAPAAPTDEGPTAAPRPHRDASTLEARIGTRWVAFAGGAVLLLALIFFLRLAFERGWIGPMARLVLGWSLGLLMWGGGDLLRRRLHGVYGEVVAATGVGIAFATTWVAFGVHRYQDLTGLSDTGGTLLLAATGVAAALHAGAVRGRIMATVALAMAHLVTVAGLGADAAGLLGAAVLGAGLLAAAAWRGWGWLAVSVQSLHLTLLAHGATGDRPELVAAATGLLILATLAAAVRQARPFADLSFAGAWLLGGWAMAVTFHEWAPFTDAAAWSLLLLGCTAAVCAVLPALRTGAAAASLVLLVMWPALHFDDPWFAAVWGLELGLLAGLARATGSRSLQTGTIALASWVALWAVMTGTEGVLVETPYIVAFVAAALGTVLAYAAGRGGPDRGIVGVAAALLVPMSAAAAFRSDPIVTLAWAGVAAAALGLGAALKDQELRFGGLSVIALVLGRILIVDMAGVDAVVRVLVFMAVGALLLGIGFAYARFLKRQKAAA